jgi:hypothetical protein
VSIRVEGIGWRSNEGLDVGLGEVDMRRGDDSTSWVLGEELSVWLEGESSTAN